MREVFQQSLHGDFCWFEVAEFSHATCVKRESPSRSQWWDCNTVQWYFVDGSWGGSVASLMISSKSVSSLVYLLMKNLQLFQCVSHDFRHLMIRNFEQDFSRDRWRDVWQYLSGWKLCGIDRVYCWKILQSFNELIRIRNRWERSTRRLSLTLRWEV